MQEYEERGEIKQGIKDGIIGICKGFLLRFGSFSRTKHTIATEVFSICNIVDMIGGFCVIVFGVSLVSTYPTYASVPALSLGMISVLNALTSWCGSRRPQSRQGLLKFCGLIAIFLMVSQLSAGVFLYTFSSKLSEYANEAGQDAGLDVDQAEKSQQALPIIMLVLGAAQVLKIITSVSLKKLFIGSSDHHGPRCEHLTLVWATLMLFLLGPTAAIYATYLMDVSTMNRGVLVAGQVISSLACVTSLVGWGLMIAAEVTAFRCDVKFVAAHGTIAAIIILLAIGKLVVLIWAAVAGGALGMVILLSMMVPFQIIYAAIILKACVQNERRPPAKQSTKPMSKTAAQQKMRAKESAKMVL
jgi:hypothetical protein